MIHRFKKSKNIASNRLRLFRWSQFVILLVVFTVLVGSANPVSSSTLFTTTQMKNLPTTAASSAPVLPSHLFEIPLPITDIIQRQNDISPSGTTSLQKSQNVDCDIAPCIALSFDDGPNAVTTPKMLDILEQAHVKASFFVVGKNIAGNEALLQRMAKDGMEIGNHTWSHKNLITLTPDQIRDELVKTQVAVQAAGVSPPTLFRPPYGAVDDVVVGSTGLQTALWNEDPNDWKATNPAALQQIILAASKPGGVIDLHDIHQVTVDAMTPTILALKDRGYQFVTVSQLQHSKKRLGRAPFYGYKSDMFRHHY